MEITDVRLRKVTGETRIKATVSITFDNVFVVHDLKVFEGTNGMFVTMPSKKTPKGQHKDIAHPLNQDTRNYIEAKVLEAFMKAE